MSKKSRRKNLKYIYEKQHYFIDRHETIAEKYFTVLTILVSTMTICLAVNFSNIPQSYRLLTLHLFVFQFICFIISFIKLINIINPMSSYFKRKNTNCNNFNESILYYRGIINNSSDYKDYLKKVENVEFNDELARQILILAKYSDEKRERLEKVKPFIIASVILSLFNFTVLILSIYF